MSRRLSAWGPAGFWAVVIFLMSTDAMSAEQTGSLLRPLLLYFFPSLSPETLDVIHTIVRKLAHVGEYVVFGFLLDRGFRRDSPLAPSRAPLAAVVVAALYSLTDEAHQSFVASRTPSLHDCGFDSLGAAIGAAAKAVFSVCRARDA